MTKEEAEALVERARPYLGQDLIIDDITYTFSDISPISCNGEEGKMICTVRAILTAPKHPTRYESLLLIVQHFER